MDELAKIIGGGLKCDNVNCDYVNMDVEINDYKNWVNKPCPLCGSNLLTEQDFAAVLAIQSIVNNINKTKSDNLHNEEDCINLTFRFDGTGNVDVE